MTIGTVSYGLGGVLFFILSILLLTSWRGRMQGAILVFASIASTIWSLTLAYAEAPNQIPFVIIFLLEILRTSAWLYFLLKILGNGGRDLVWRSLYVSIVTLPFILAAMGVTTLASDTVASIFGGITSIQTYGALSLAMIGLVLVEQVYRNSRSDQRWALKYLCIGIGGIFAFDLFLYSHGLIFRHIDLRLWDVRGIINSLVVPLIGISAARNPQWSLDVYISRRIVLYATSIVGIGLYLIAMAIATYYLHFMSGDWNVLVQAVFLFGACLLMFSIMLSGRARARIKVFLSKNFFNYRYDYREEWLRLIKTLSSSDGDLPIQVRTIKAMAQIVESPAGVLFMLHRDNEFVPVACWNMRRPENVSEPVDSEFSKFMINNRWVIDVAACQRQDIAYKHLQLPLWLSSLARAWLVIPVMHEESMLGFMILAQSRAPYDLTWEDNDLLKTVGRQVASYLVQYESDQKLAESKQFETYSRLMAFMMHDLKNLILQLSLVLKNAAKHRNNPAFIETVFGTVENSVARMKRLLDQLKQRDSNIGSIKHLNIRDILCEAVKVCSERKPIPEIVEAQDAWVTADSERLALVIEHVIQNAQEATREDGCVRLVLKRADANALLIVSDNGIGMDADFVRSRLFKPFDSTKGGKGMGIGAYQVREVIEGMGGSVNVVSKIGKGTEFSIILPLISRNHEL